VSSKGRAGGAISSSLSLTSLILLKESLWQQSDSSAGDSDRAEYEDETSKTNKRKELSTLMMNWCRDLIYGYSLVSNQQSSMGAPSLNDRRQSLQSDLGNVSKTSSLDSIADEAKGSGSAHVRNMEIIEPSVLVSIVVAMIACGRINSENHLESLEVSIPLTH
jgi:hypothetical protein